MKNCDFWSQILGLHLLHVGFQVIGRLELSAIFHFFLKSLFDCYEKVGQIVSLTLRKGLEKISQSYNMVIQMKLILR